MITFEKKNRFIFLKNMKKNIMECLIFLSSHDVGLYSVLIKEKCMFNTFLIHSHSLIKIEVIYFHSHLPEILPKLFYKLNLLTQRINRISDKVKCIFDFNS